MYNNPNQHHQQQHQQHYQQHHPQYQQQQAYQNPNQAPPQGQQQYYYGGNGNQNPYAQQQQQQPQYQQYQQQPQGVPAGYPPPTSGLYPAAGQLPPFNPEYQQQGQPGAYPPPPMPPQHYGQPAYGYQGYPPPASNPPASFAPPVISGGQKVFTPPVVPSTQKVEVKSNGGVRELTSKFNQNESIKPKTFNAPPPPPATAITSNDFGYVAVNPNFNSAVAQNANSEQNGPLPSYYQFRFHQPAAPAPAPAPAPTPARTFTPPAPAYGNSNSISVSILNSRKGAGKLIVKYQWMEGEQNGCRLGPVKTVQIQPMCSGSISDIPICNREEGSAWLSLLFIDYGFSHNGGPAYEMSAHVKVFRDRKPAISYSGSNGLNFTNCFTSNDQSVASFNTLNPPCYAIANIYPNDRDSDMPKGGLTFRVQNYSLKDNEMIRVWVTQFTSTRCSDEGAPVILCEDDEITNDFIRYTNSKEATTELVIIEQMSTGKRQHFMCKPGVINFSGFF